MEERGFETRENAPVWFECIDVAVGNAAIQVGRDVLDVLRRLAVDVAWQVEVELIFLDLRKAHQARVLGDVELPGKDIDDLVDVLSAQAVLGAVLHVATAGVDHEDALARVGVLLIDDDDAGAFAGALQGADDVQQVGVVALPGGRHAEGLEAFVGVVGRVETGAPALVAKGRIGDHIVEGLERVAVLELGIGQRIALYNERRGVVVQDHVHARQTAGRVIHGGSAGGPGVADAENLRNHPAHLGRGVELALAFAALGGEVAHQIFVGIAQDIIAIGAVPGKVEGRVLEDSDEVGEAIHHLLAAAELGGVIEVREVGQPVGISQRGDDLLVDLVADVRLALERHHVLEAGARGDDDGSEMTRRLFVAEVLATFNGALADRHSVHV